MKRHGGPLCARPKRAYENRASNTCDELPPLHSTPLQLRRCSDTISSQFTPHRFVASQWALMNDGRCGSSSDGFGAQIKLVAWSLLPSRADVRSLPFGEAVRFRGHLDLGAERSHHPVDAVALKSAEPLVGGWKLMNSGPGSLPRCLSHAFRAASVRGGNVQSGGRASTRALSVASSALILPVSSANVQRPSWVPVISAVQH
jgi:hypothetical protein